MNTQSNTHQTTHTMTLHEKLFQVQAKVGKISKDMDNPFFKSKYFDINKLIEQITPVLQEHGLLLLQPIEDGKVYSRIIDTESSAQVDSSMKLPDNVDPQKMGSAVTYLRRYTLQSLLALQAEDDDGNAASQPVKKKANLTPNHPKWAGAVESLKSGKVTMTTIKKHYNLTAEHQRTLEVEAND